MLRTMDTKKQNFKREGQLGGMCESVLWSIPMLALEVDLGSKAAMDEPKKHEMQGQTTAQAHECKSALPIYSTF